MAPTNPAPLTALLLPRLRANRWAIALLAAVQCAAALCALMLPSINARLVDSGVAQGRWDVIRHEAQIMAIFIAAGLLLSVTAAVLGSLLSARIAAGVRGALFDASIDLDTVAASHLGNHALLTRGTNDVNKIQQVVFVTATVLAVAPINIIGGSALSAQVSTVPLPVTIAAGVLLLVFVMLLLRRLLPLFGREQRILERMNRVLSEQMRGVRTIRAFGRERGEAARFQRENDELTGVARTLGAYQALLLPVVLVITNCAILAAVAVGAMAIDSERMQIGQVIAYVGYLTIILGGVSMASLLVTVLPQASVSARRILEVLQRPSAITDIREPVEIESRTGRVSMRAVSVRYEQAPRPVFTDVSFDADPGTITCITGGLGCGKSTLLSLLPRLVDAEQGTVAVDGVDVRSQSLAGLRGGIGYLSQQPILAGGTIREAIAATSATDVDDDELWWALRAACVDDVVEDHADGLDRVVAPRGVNFSGGQRQRLALARALVTRPTLVVLDDPFSALDDQTSDRVHAQLRSLPTPATIVIATHRPTVLWAADQVVHLVDGASPEVGTARELVSESARFAELFRLADEATG